MDQMAAWVKDQARLAGFDLVGIAPAQSFREHLALKQWLVEGKHATMTWIEKSLEKRLDPLKVMPEAKSVIMCAVNYNTRYPYSVNMASCLSARNSSRVTIELVTRCGFARSGMMPQRHKRGWISRYAWGDDYHIVIEKRLKKLAEFLCERFPKNTFRFYTDTGPVMERVFAQHARIGWIGKNTCVINRKIGSWLFLSALLTDLELIPDVPETDHCGTCTRCIDVCPTQAITQPYEVDARKCISYLTIEHRGEIEPELQKKMGNHLFGCDICQDVCPWNRKAPVTCDPAFHPREGFFAPNLEIFRRRVEEDYPEGFAHSPLKRAKSEGLLRNLAIAMGDKRG